MSNRIHPDLHATLAERSRHLQAVAQSLKTELFGIDDVIDRVIDSLRAWYVLPQLIDRPVVICLWGLTGTGKTQLVRRLARHLGFHDRFIEVQMGGFSHGSGHRSAGSISAMLAESGIAAGERGILMLDEFQRFRTVDKHGSRARVERDHDVWALLSDGRLPSSLSTHGEIASDCSKLLVFVAGKLDEMYAQTARRVEDCDTDADLFHALTRKLSLIDVKKALAERFKPEQIARLGNNHVIYPSFDRATYVRLIRSTCDRYVAEIQESSGVRFVLDAGVCEQIYANAVFPAQGTRPLFSSIHAILGASLVHAALWALEQGASGAEPVWLRLDAGDGARGQAKMVARFRLARREFPVVLELNALRQRADADWRALRAVHEAGHGLVHALLFGRAPKEIRIHATPFDGGCNRHLKRQAGSTQNTLDSLCVSLAGRAAEQLVFGDAGATTGAEQELDNDAAATIPEIEQVLAREHMRALELIESHTTAFLAVVDALMAQGSIARAELAALLGLPLAATGPEAAPEAEALEAYATRLASFKARGTPPALGAARLLRALA